MSKPSGMNRASEVTKGLAILLLSSKDVYLTSEGKKALEIILKEKNAYEGKLIVIELNEQVN